MTSIYKNPFHLLNATTRDNRHQIVELYEEKSLLLDSDVCSKARSDLTNPRIRLSAEIAWLPGLSPKRTLDLIELLNNNPVAIKNQNNIPPLPLANLLAASIEALDPEVDLENWTEYILIFVKTVDDISVYDIFRDINEDRAIAGFPRVKSLELIEPELTNRRSYYKSVVKEAINQLPIIKLVEVMTAVVEVSTHNGEVHAPMLIDELVDSYETETRSFLQRESENVLELVESAKQATPRGEDAVRPILDKLDAVVRNWDKVAQPIQVSMKSRGLNHDMSHDLANKIRNFGVELANEHSMLEATRQVTETLQEVFAELPEVVSQLDEDASAIERLFVERDEAQSNYEEWAKKITFNANIGWFFKNTLAISPEGLWWKNLHFPLNKITRVRWGGTSNSTGTTYSICFGDNRRMAVVDPGSSGVYEQFVDKLWNAVCVRILTEMLVSLKKGSRYEFGDAVVDDYGVEVTKRKFISSVRVYGKWYQVRIYNGNGSFILGIDGDKNAYSEMPYQEVDNVHILEAAMRMFFKSSNTRLSSLLKR